MRGWRLSCLFVRVGSMTMSVCLAYWCVSAQCVVVLLLGAYGLNVCLSRVLRIVVRCSSMRGCLRPWAQPLNIYTNMYAGPLCAV